MMFRFSLPVVVALFVSTPALAAPKSTPPAFEPKAHALLKKVFDRYRTLRSYSGTMRWTRGGTSLDAMDMLIASGQTQVRFARPQLFLSSRIDNSQFAQRYVDDGESIYVNALPEEVMRFSHGFVKQDELWKFAHASDFGIKELLQKRNPLQPYGSYVVSIAPGAERKKGEAHVIVRLKAPNARAQVDYFLGRQDLSLRGVRIHQVIKGKSLDMSEEHSQIQFNPTIPASAIEPDDEMKRHAEEGTAQPTPEFPITPAIPPIR